MTGTSTVEGVSMLAHGLHVAMLLGGLWGLAALLLPQAVERRTRCRASEPPLRYDGDEHARRVAELRRAAASGALASGATLVTPAPTPSASPARTPAVSLPLVLVAGTAAAGIHAAVAPAHLLEEPLFGLFFLLVAGAQLGWVAALATRPSDFLLRAGIALNLALIGLWLVTRTLGLPFGLLPEPHPVGGWDVACVLWQGVVVFSCHRLLRDSDAVRIPPWLDWHPSTRAAVGAAAVALVLLTVTGAHS